MVLRVQLGRLRNYWATCGTSSLKLVLFVVVFFAVSCLRLEKWLILRNTHRSRVTHWSITSKYHLSHMFALANQQCVRNLAPSNALRGRGSRSDLNKMSAIMDDILK